MDEILNLIDSVSEVFSSYSYSLTKLYIVPISAPSCQAGSNDMLYGKLHTSKYTVQNIFASKHVLF